MPEGPRPSYSGIFSAFANSPTMPRRNSSTTTTNTTPWITVIAADRGIKIGTVRAHTKTVFSKTQTRDQAELTGLLTRRSFVVPRMENASAASAGGGAADRDRARRNGARSSEPQAAAGSGWRR